MTAVISSPEMREFNDFGGTT